MGSPASTLSWSHGDQPTTFAVAALGGTLQRCPLLHLQEFEARINKVLADYKQKLAERTSHHMG